MHLFAIKPASDIWPPATRRKSCIHLHLDGRQSVAVGLTFQRRRCSSVARRRLELDLSYNSGHMVTGPVLRKAARDMLAADRKRSRRLPGRPASISAARREMRPPIVHASSRAVVYKAPPSSRASVEIISLAAGFVCRTRTGVMTKNLGLAGRKCKCSERVK